MVNESVNELEARRAAERRLVLSYAPAASRMGAAALMALDDTLGQVLKTTREPMIGQMRLTWWHDALMRLDGRAPPAEPVLQGLAAHVLPAGVTGAALARLVEGWEMLLDPLDADAGAIAAGLRGETLFAAAARVLDAADPRIGEAGRGWALADLARGLSDQAVAAALRDRALAKLDPAFQRRWPTRARMLSALALAARMDLRHPDQAPASPRRTGRLMFHRLTGR